MINVCLFTHIFIFSKHVINFPIYFFTIYISDVLSPLSLRQGARTIRLGMLFCPGCLFFKVYSTSSDRGVTKVTPMTSWVINVVCAVPTSQYMMVVKMSGMTINCGVCKPRHMFRFLISRREQQNIHSSLFKKFVSPTTQVIPFLHQKTDFTIISPP